MSIGPVPLRRVGVHRDGVVRWLTVLPPDARATYRGLVAAVAPRIESSLRPCVLANRVQAASADPPLLRLRPWRAERRAFQSALGRLAAHDAVLAFADVRSCFPSVLADVVVGALERIGCAPGAVEDVSAFLGRLERAGIAGLPVGPEPSAVLANAVLSTADEALAADGYRHLRWVDDVVIAAADEASAMRGVATFADALGGLGLSLNADKTRVVVDPTALVGSTRWSRTGAPATVG